MEKFIIIVEDFNLVILIIVGLSRKKFSMYVSNLFNIYKSLIE